MPSCKLIFRNFAVACLFFAPLTAHAWGFHYLITDRALARPELAATLDARVPVEHLDVFLKKEAPALAHLFSDYYAWLGATGSKRFKPQTFDPAHPDEQAFLRAARLNPSTRFQYVERLLPGEKATAPRVEFRSLSPDEKIEPRFHFDFQETPKETSARSILRTFADEPDWQIDSGLWAHEEYGYGKPPYGKADGESAGAAFHSFYSHENWLVRWLAPEVGDGQAPIRIELFSRLARLAHATGHPYWGYRFTAWAFHYIQDLSQPYHSQAVPYANAWFYFRFAVSTDKARFKSEATNLVYIRHHLFEDFVSVLLERFYLAGAKDQVAVGTISALSEPAGAPFVAGATPVLAFVGQVGDRSSAEAFNLDHAVESAYGPRRSADPNYDIDHDTTYDPFDVFKSAAPTALSELVRETRVSLTVAGEATRQLLFVCSPSLSKRRS